MQIPCSICAKIQNHRRRLLFLDFSFDCDKIKRYLYVQSKERNPRGGTYFRIGGYDPMHKKGLYERYFKRPQDFVLSLAAIAALSPVMAAEAYLVYRKLGKPVIFKQQRPGLNGKPFFLYKFRTMSNDRDENGTLLPDEQRLGSFGKKLRNTSLDELPSLFNVVRGDLSFVGPRPLLMEYLPRYSERQARRHEVRPGLTGYAQVNGRNAISWEQRVDYDVDYVDHVTFFGDWKILIQTVLVVLQRKGISSDSSVTMEKFMGSQEEH